MKRKPATKAELAHLGRVKQLPCVACQQHFQRTNELAVMQCGVTESHHALSGGRRRGHMHIVSLGSWHHRAIPLQGWTAAEMEAFFGPSLANGSKPFHESFGTDEELLALTNQLLNKHSSEAA